MVHNKYHIVYIALKNDCNLYASKKNNSVSDKEELFWNYRYQERIPEEQQDARNNEGNDTRSGGDSPDET